MVPKVRPVDIINGVYIGSRGRLLNR